MHCATRPTKRLSQQPLRAALPRDSRERDNSPVLVGVAGTVAARFKTRLCTKYEDTGDCPYATHCVFAHGAKDLRTEALNIAEGIVDAEGISRYRKRAAQRRKRQARAVRRDGDEQVVGHHVDADDDAATAAVADARCGILPPPPPPEEDRLLLVASGGASLGADPSADFLATPGTPRGSPCAAADARRSLQLRHLHRSQRSAAMPTAGTQRATSPPAAVGATLGPASPGACPPRPRRYRHDPYGSLPVSRSGPPPPPPAEL